MRFLQRILPKVVIKENNDDHHHSFIVFFLHETKLWRNMQQRTTYNNRLLMIALTAATQFTTMTGRVLLLFRVFGGPDKTRSASF
jgi:hypothetical protein